jgi:CubicO group peptidase (beta-lactamase class C family)/D-alanyl-D-alanine dipeptidase
MIRTILFFAIPILLFPLPIPIRGDGDIAPASKYAALVDSLKPWIDKEVKAKQLPALSIALVDDQKIVWSHGFGFADPLHKTAATADTVYRVGSVSKPFTTLLLMMLVEMGLIDLDAPVQNYLPKFQPKNPYKKAITLRQMVSHRSGLVRESPVGNYFDDSSPSLAETVRSLNETTLVYEPETKTSYSNAALATVGYVLERTQKEAFPKLMQAKLLDPLGMKNSSFDPGPKLREKMAQAVMWTYHGREFPAPVWDMGMGPAGSLYSTANDMGKFLSFLFARGKAGEKQLLKKETLESMWKIQFAKKGDKTGFGLSFFVSEFEGRRRIGHGGAVYGFATDLSALPDDKLGVVVIASRDVANAVTRHIADVALKGMLAVRNGKPLPKMEETTAIDRDLARKLEGRYQSDKKGADLVWKEGKLFLYPLAGGSRVELRTLGKEIIADDLLGYGVKVIPEFEKDQLKIGDKTYKRVPTPKPGPVPSKFRGLIGEYGPDHNILYIFEKDGKLHCLIEWVFLYPLEEVNENEYKFPDFGLYQGDKLIFKRDKTGRATSVEAASVPFRRRKIPGETAKVFTIKPSRPLDELRKLALAAKPPEEKNPLFKKLDLVDVTKLDDTIKLDIRYATTDNFLETPFYTSARAFMQRPAAEALVRVHKKLADKGFGLLIHDAYRPWFVTKMFWDATPEKWHMFVADPLQGSRHNRGCAVDLTLYDLKTGRPVIMPGLYDEFSDRSYADYPGGTSRQRWHRDLLRRAMEEQGFTVYPAEWWHFDYRDWRQYPIMNVTFEKVK